MVLGQFGGDKTRHGRFARKKGEGTPSGLQHPAGRFGRGQGYSLRNRRAVKPLQESVDPVPKYNGCAIRKKKCPARRRMTRLSEGVQREHMGLGGVTHMG